LREKAMGCGAAAYLPKPFRGTTLLEAVKGAIEPAPHS
jgi:FixJ family two-component response regulator